MEMDLLAPTVSELESRIHALEMRNVELEVRNVQLTKALSAASVQSGNKIDVVNKFHPQEESRQNISYHIQKENGRKDSCSSISS